MKQPWSSTTWLMQRCDAHCDDLGGPPPRLTDRTRKTGWK